MLCDGLLELDSNNIILDVDYENTVSPKYYNFSNDSINCEIEFNDKLLQEFINNNKEKFKEYITSRYTSCSGFISSYSNDVENWMEVKGYNEHEIGSVLNFVLNELNENAEISLLEASNNYESFYNFEFNFDECIRDFNEQKRAV